MDWITMPLSAVPEVLISTLGIYVAVILFTRISGLRSFSKMSSFDFAMTVAVGSVVATTITLREPPLMQSVLALAALFALQMLIAYLRKKEYSFIKIVDNRPVLLMDGPNMLEENMARAQVTRNDLLEKLREANVTHLGQVKAVVFETTGDVSVMHDNNPDRPLDDILIENVLRNNKDSF